MEVENISSFGRGLVGTLSDPDYKNIKRQMIMSFVKILHVEIGLVGMTKMMWRTSKEKKIMKKHDWSNIEKRGFCKENLKFLIEDTAYMKILVNMMGENKACSLFSEVLQKTDENLGSGKTAQNLLLIPANEIEFCDDKFVGFKEFIKASEDEMEREGTHKIDILQDTKNTLAYDVRYCVAHEVAKEFGNPIYCFPWCHIDEIVLPKIGAHLGFSYERISTLSSGASKCVFKFDRMLN